MIVKRDSRLRKRLARISVDTVENITEADEVRIESDLVVMRELTHSKEFNDLLLSMSIENKHRINI